MDLIKFYDIPKDLESFQRYWSTLEKVTRVSGTYAIYSFLVLPACISKLECLKMYINVSNCRGRKYDFVGVNPNRMRYIMQDASNPTRIEFGPSHLDKKDTLKMFFASGIEEEFRYSPDYAYIAYVLYYPDKRVKDIGIKYNYGVNPHTPSLSGSFA